MLIECNRGVAASGWDCWPFFVRSLFICLLLLLLFSCCFSATSFAWAETLPTGGEDVAHGEIEEIPTLGETGEKEKSTERIIRSIEIRVGSIFGDEQGWIYRKAEQIHYSTKEKVVRRELLFAEGDVFYPFLIAETERILRTLRYLRNVEITTTEVGRFVDVIVYVQDTWSLIPQVGFSATGGDTNYTIGLAESNLAGLGKRAELLYRQRDGRQMVEAVWDDRRVMGSDVELLAAYFDRNDGEVFQGSFGRPFRSFVDKDAWGASGGHGDTIGRLFEAGDERFIYRNQKDNLEFRYSVAHGDPEVVTKRFSLGYGYESAQFGEASYSDYAALSLNPDELSQDPALLAADRRFSGPLFAFSYIENDFVARNYIDRFDRVQDYNLGRRYNGLLQIAPKWLGSRYDAVLANFSAGDGWELNQTSFLRSEFGVATRLTDSEFEDTLARVEANYYNVLGECRLGRWSFGQHTLAGNFSIDYGEQLSKDRQFWLGGHHGLRGYSNRTFVGDKSIILNLEDRAHLLDDVWRLFSVGSVVFADVGGATYDNFGDLIINGLYSNVGAGLRFAFPRFTGSGIIRIDVAIPLRDGPDGSERFEPRFLISGGQYFSSWLRGERVGAERATVGVGFDR